jgi:soluble lytic murein transglycosylase-like protein
MKRNLFALSMFFSCMACADVYKFVDDSGKVFYTDQKQSSLYKKIHILSPYRKKLSENYKKVLVNQYMAANSFSSSLHSPYKSIASHSPYRFKRNYGGYPTIYSGYSSGGFSPNKSRFTSMISQAANRNRVDERLVHAVIQTESAYNPSAVSRAGAVGLMQLMPGTAARYGVFNRNDPVQNVDAGTRYLKDLLDMFDYNLGLAVAAYNAGEGAVMKYNYSIPPYPETQNYVRQVLARYNQPM